ncbi:MAG: hypothetical protein Q9183_005741 [Haloplaca sp. 2 TL-2023]
MPVGNAQALTLLYKAALWTTVSAATLFTIGRYAIRYRVKRSFYWDDLAHLFAWILMIGCCAVIQNALPNAEIIVDSSSPPPDTVLAFRKQQLALTLLFILSLWGVKFAFMFLYRLLFWASTTFRKLWWCAMAILLVTVWVPVAANLTLCGPTSDSFNPEACEAHVAHQNLTNQYVCGVHVGTDLIVMALPWYVIRKVQTSRARKIGLAAIFSVVFITIACDILRTIKSVDQGAFSDSALYTFLEVTLAVIVSTLPTYRKLLSSKSRKDVPAHHSEELTKSKGGYRQRLWKAPRSTTSQEKRAWSSFRTLSSWKRSKRTASSDEVDSGRVQDLPLELPPVHLSGFSRGSTRVNSLV